MPEPRNRTGSWSTAFLSSAPGLHHESAALTEDPADSATQAVPEGPLFLTIHGNLDRIVGSVSHPGPVHVRGSVDPDLTVFAAGSIRVDGDVRGAKLISGDRIDVWGSVGGPGASQLDALGDVMVRSARLAEITAGGDVRCRDAMVQCRVHAVGRVILDGTPGLLSGGDVRAAAGIRARRMGSAYERPTALWIGEGVSDADTASLGTRLKLCGDAASRTARRLDDLCARFDALTEGRAAAIGAIRRLVGERARTQRLQASLVRRRRQAAASEAGDKAGLEAEVVLAGVILDEGWGPERVVPRGGRGA